MHRVYIIHTPVITHFYYLSGSLTRSLKRARQKAEKNLMGTPSVLKKVALLFLVLAAVPTFSLAVDPTCGDFVKPVAETAKGTDSNPATVEELEAQAEIVLTRSQKIAAYAKRKGTALGLLFVGCVVGGITKSYEDEVGALYVKHIRDPFRKYLLKRHFTNHPGEREHLDADIAEFQLEAKALGGPGWKNMGHEDQLAQISDFESKFASFLTPFRAFSSSVDEDVESKKELLKGLADQLLPLESIYTDARIRAADPSLSPENRKAVNDLITSSQTQLDDAVSLWNIYLIGSPEAEKTAFYPGEITKFVQSKQFVLSNTDPKAYARSLASRADEVAKIINGVIQ
jgi:hypothetical protein